MRNSPMSAGGLGMGAAAQLLGKITLGNHPDHIPVFLLKQGRGTGADRFFHVHLLCNHRMGSQ